MMLRRPLIGWLVLALVALPAEQVKVDLDASVSIALPRDDVRAVGIEFLRQIGQPAVFAIGPDRHQMPFGPAQVLMDPRFHRDGVWSELPLREPQVWRGVSVREVLDRFCADGTYGWELRYGVIWLRWGNQEAVELVVGLEQPATEGRDLSGFGYDLQDRVHGALQDRYPEYEPGLFFSLPRHDDRMGSVEAMLPRRVLPDMTAIDAETIGAGFAATLAAFGQPLLLVIDVEIHGNEAGRDRLSWDALWLSYAPEHIADEDLMSLQVHPQDRPGWWSAAVLGHYARYEMVRRAMLDSERVAAAFVAVNPLKIIADSAPDDPSRRSYGYARLLDLRIVTITQAVAEALAADVVAIDANMLPDLAEYVPAPGEWGYDPVLLPVYRSMVARFDHYLLLRLIGQRPP